jgi:sulfur relay (sulfurtransferase) DsrF/TusC family protein|tara:strand:+ start:1932 stop:2282 length:351 start_codon:yes stop_codon:yes gene_type:complete
MNSTAIVIRHGPGTGLGTREMLDMALVLATFDCPVTVILQDDGVYWSRLPSLPEGNPLSLSGRLKSLPLYDVGPIIVHSESCDSRSVIIDLGLPSTVLSTSEILDHLSTIDVILEA